MLCMHCCPCIGILFTYAMSLFRHIVYLCHVLFFLYASFQSTLSRAQWSPQNTWTFCQLYVDEIDRGTTLGVRCRSGLEKSDRGLLQSDRISS